MTKEELQLKVNELTQSLDTFNKNTEMLKQDLAVAQNALKVADRPKITQDQMTEIQDAIYTVVNNVDFTDCNSYDMDFEIDYDNRIAVSNPFKNFILPSNDFLDSYCFAFSIIFFISIFLYDYLD